MKLFTSARVWLGAALLVAGTSAPAAEPSVAAGNSAFAAELYAQIAPPDGNLFFSPYSISLALALASAGARGETAAEMARVLHLPPDPAAAAAGFAAVAQRLAALPPADATLTVANSLWYQSTYHLNAAYLRLVRTSYRAKIQPVDFIGRPGGAAADINRWVQAATQDRIQNLVSPAAIGRTTRVVLANAIYFKGDWASEFHRSRTQPALFASAPGYRTLVPTMHQSQRYRWTQLAGFRLLELPYHGHALSLLLLLPDAPDGLPGIERQMDGARLANWLGQLDAASQTDINLSLPRFTVSSGLELSAALQRLGLTDAFDLQRADFSGMSSGRDFRLSQVLHKAEVEVNEEGTVASAATGAVMRSLAVVTPLEFRVDHPFLFFIRENATGTLLFVGRITQPQP